MFDVFGSAQSVTLVWVDHERYPLTDSRSKLPDLAKWRDRVPFTVEGEDRTVGGDAGAEQGSV
jgi:hypothetical protein